MANETITFILKAQNLASREMSGFGGVLQGIDKSTSMLSLSTVALGTALGGLAVKGIGMATRALGDMVGEAIAFDKAMLNVNSIAQVNDATFGRMKNSVIQLSTELPQSASKLAEGLYNIQSSGFAGEKGLIVLDAAAKAASAGLTDTNVSAAGLTAVLNSYGLKAGESARISDIMFETVNRGVLTFEELSQNIGSTTSLAAPLGVSFEEVAAALSLMTRQGVNAAEATTSIESVMRSLLKPSAEATKLAGELGLGWNAAALESKGLVGVLTDMIKATGGNKETMATLLGDARAIRGAMVLAAGGTEAFVEELGYMENAAGATDTVLSYQKKGLAYQFEVLQNKVTAAGLAIAEEAIPAMNDLWESVEDATDALGRQDDKFRGLEDDVVRISKILGVSYGEARDVVLDANERMGMGAEELADRMGTGWRLAAEGAHAATAAMHPQFAAVREMVATTADSVETSTGEMEDDFVGVGQVAVDEMQAMIDGLTSMFESETELNDAWTTLVERMADPYTEAERKADIFGQTTIDNIQSAIVSGDPVVAADAATLVNNMLGQFALMEPGALERGRAVPPAMRSGMDSQVGALISYIETSVIGKALTALTLDEATALGLDGIWRYAQGMRSNELNSNAAARYVAGRAKEALAAPDYFGTGGTAVTSYGGGIEGSEWRSSGAARDVSSAAKVALQSANFYSGGQSIIGTWMAGMLAKFNSGTWMLTDILYRTRQHLGGSLPEVGPLKGNTAYKGGASIGEAWMSGITDSIGSMGALGTTVASVSGLLGNVGGAAIAPGGFGGGGAGMSAGGGSPVVIELRLGKDKIAEVIDTHLYYANRPVGASALPRGT